MGFQRSTLKLVFDDPELAGLEVRARRLSIESFMSIMRLRGLDWSHSETVEQFCNLAEELVKVLISWNLDDEDGEPVPLTVSAIIAQDYGLIFKIIGALLEGTAGVSPPLPKPSPSGDTSLEESIPMEVMSESPPS